MPRLPVSPLVGQTGELVVRRLVVAARDVVFVKGVIEASEGIASVFAEAGGDLTIAAPVSRAEELDRVLMDLARETAALVAP